MKSRPILFSAPMVRAILTCAQCGKISVPFPCEHCGSREFRKGQTRRIFAPERIKIGTYPDGTLRYDTYAKRNREIVHTGCGPFIPNDWLHYCPYGVPGDGLWLQEAFRVVYITSDPAGPLGYSVLAEYAADGYRSCKWVPKTHAGMPSAKPRPAFLSGRFMPKWASRVLLVNNGVRVEQVQEITPEDVLAEGVRKYEQGPIMNRFGLEDWPPGERQATARGAFVLLWNQINAKRGYGWAANPYVWALTFERAEI